MSTVSVDMFWQALQDDLADPQTILVLRHLAQDVNQRSLWLEFFSGMMMTLVMKKFRLQSVLAEESREHCKTIVNRWLASRQST